MSADLLETTFLVVDNVAYGAAYDHNPSQHHHDGEEEHADKQLETAGTKHTALTY